MAHSSNGHRSNHASRAHALTDGMTSIKDRVEEAVERNLATLKTGSKRAAKAGRRKVLAIRATTGEAVSRNPLRSVLAASVAGALLGFFLGRR
ncbi:MAG: hypothetical protein K8T20_03000 [Planctomycetes bacterium]|nr:hypothetical protein [Planctomycetota bacterium]